jgi:N-acetylglucosaminyldiphosphoundecaprenol N-acetyl-beta-D-mannosaminyltransferase
MSSITLSRSGWIRDGRRFRLKRRPEERVRVLGAEMDLVRFEEVFHFVAERLAAGEKSLIANHNLHSLYLIQRHAPLRAFFEKAHLIEVDSMPLIFWARLMGSRSRKFHRCTYLDWRQEFWALAVEKGWRVFFLGGRPGVAEAAKARLLAQWPAATLEVHTGYFDTAQGSADNEALLQQLEAYRPDILLVGMGMPVQELWLLENYDRLPTCAMFPIGGAFDYEAGVQKECPRLIGQFGLEWLFRLFMDPRRLFHRYCVEPCFLFLPAMRDMIGRFGRAYSEHRASQP